MVSLVWDSDAALIDCLACTFAGQGTQLGRVEDAGSPIAIVRCPQCGSIALQGELLDFGPTEEDIDAYVGWGGGIHALSRATTLAERLQARSLLDVGCYYGFLPHLAHQLLGCDVLGVEPSDAGRRGTRELGIPILHEPFSADTELPGRFDLVTMSEVIEHVRDPASLASAAGRALAPDGVLFLTTPAAEAITPDRPLGFLYPLLSPHLHHFLFSAAGMRELLNRVGFGSVDVAVNEGALTAVAALAPEAPLPSAADIGQVDVARLAGYFDATAETTPPGSMVALGMAARHFQNLVNLGEYAAAEPSFERLTKSLQQRGVDPTEPQRLDLAQLGTLAPLMIRTAFAAGILSFLGRHRVPEALDYFALGLRICAGLEDNGEQLDPEEQDLRGALERARQTVEASAASGAGPAPEGSDTVTAAPVASPAARADVRSVSVVMPVYNGRRTIAEAVESVARQTSRPVELIVVDDCGTDDSIEIVQGLEVPFPVRFLRTERNAGQSEARNTGIRAASGSLIALIDQDDRWLPDHLALLAPVFASDPSLGWVFSDFHVMDADGQVSQQNYLAGQGVTGVRHSLEELLAGDIMALPSASLLRARAITEVGGFDPGLIGYEDDDLYLRIFRAGYTQAFVPRSTACHRVHPSTSKSLTFHTSGLRYMNKLLTTVADDHSYFNKYYSQDCIVPRFLAKATSDYLQYLALDDFPNAVASWEMMSQVLAERGFRTRGEYLAFQFGMRCMARPRFFRSILAILSRVPRFLLPPLVRKVVIRDHTAVRARGWYRAPRTVTTATTVHHATELVEVR